MHERQDLGRTLDYLATRNDIRRDGLVYLGFSRGAAQVLFMLALEDRFATAILISGGIAAPQPEVSGLNYAPRIRMPVLMLNGRYDHIFPVETSQRPLFEHLGTPPEHKRHVLYDAGHYPLPRSQWIPEATRWLEKYAP